jgi:hypothetical protein
VTASCISAGTCDVAENCTGSAATCPNDVLVTAGTLCRASAGVCDVAENCTGAAAACPANGFVASTTTCRASAGVCDVAENCTGAAAACPNDAPQPAGAECRATATECDVAENCNGVTTSCPADAFRPDSTACTDDGVFCTSDVCISGLCEHPDKVGSGPEVCYDLIDNNDDCNTDCTDPLCNCAAVIKACNHLCVSSIKFGKNGCRYKLEGAFTAGTPHDPLLENFSVLMTNIAGTLTSGTLPPGSFLQRGDVGHYIYRDRFAIRTGGFSKVRLYPDKGNPSITRFSVTMHDVCSTATTPFMTTQVVLGTETFYTEGDWTSLQSGWVTELP